MPNKLMKMAQGEFIAFQDADDYSDAKRLETQMREFEKDPELAVCGDAVRPLVFLFPAAEEVGLLGSIHFVRQHSAEMARVHAVLHVDAGAPPAPPTRWRLAAGTRSWAGTVAAAVIDARGWSHRADAGSPNSDHWPFVQHGVPAVFLIPDGGWEGLDEAGAQALRERWDRYHQPDDEWASDFPFAGLARYATLARDIAYALAATETAAR